jgi:FMN reductase
VTDIYANRALSDVPSGSATALEESRRRPLIVAIGGSTRANSSSERALKMACDHLVHGGAIVDIYSGPQLKLPIYDAAGGDLPEEAAPIVQSLIAADAVIVSSPAYHGSISGAIKNVLDYCQELPERGVPYLDGLAFGCITVGYGWQAPIFALDHLRTIAHSLRAWPTPYGAALNVREQSLSVSGENVESDASRAVTLVASQVLKGSFNVLAKRDSRATG